MLKRQLYLPGFLAVMLALGRFTLKVEWDTTATAVMVVGVLILLVSVAWNLREIRAWFVDPRGAFALGTGFSTLLLLGIVILLNVVANARAVQVDLTTADRNTIGPESRDLVARLDRDVVLRQFGRAPSPATEQLLASLAGAGPRIRLIREDVERDPQLAREYNVLRSGTVIVVSGSTYRKVEEPTEQALMTALLQVTSDVQHALCFVAGHGERGLADESGVGLTRLVAALEAANYLVTPVTLLDREALADCSVVLIVGPTIDLDVQELDRLEPYMNHGGRLAVLIDPLPLPQLSDWVATFGIEPQAGILVDQSGAGQSVGGGPDSPLALHYNDHPIVRGFGIATMYGKARPLGVQEQSDRGGHPLALALTGPRSFIETKPTSGLTFDNEEDLPGAAPLVAVNELKIRQPAPNPPAIARLFVAGDADFIANGLLGRQGNRDFFLRALSWLAGEAEATIVRVEEPENRRIDLTERTRTVMYAVNLGLLPLLPVLVGLIVYWRGRS